MLGSKRPTDSAAPMAAGYPKRAKRPMLDDIPTPSSASLINNTNFASLSHNERDKLLQMLEQESSVRRKLNFSDYSMIFFSRRKNLMRHL